VPSNKSYAVDERYDAEWNRFPLHWLQLFSEGLELALTVEAYTDKHEINRTLESLHRNRNAREKSDAMPEPTIVQELWKGIAEVGRLRRGLDLFLSEPKFRTRLDRTVARALRDSLEVAENSLKKQSI
jgi:hypothetical protein